ncbi:MAG: T9SS type A sorting domain-containing protein [Lentimicrobiaceae bacterium]|nr:T9SS type A sorting domain-containing protein [Lentimicrobiaceae bacterium]
MKRTLLTIIISLVISSSIMAQNVARECVLFEVFTGVNCPWCPGAATAIGRMLEEGKSVAPVAYHTSAFSVPELYTNETNARANYYYISGYPTVKVDGMLSPSMSGNGGNEQHAQQAYNQGMNAYNQRINVSSPYTIDLSFEYQSGTECKVTATVNKVGECNSNDVRLFIVLTESHIQRTWQGMQEVNFVTRDMIPNQNGTQLTSDIQTIEATINMDGFPRENCDIVAWVQNFSGNKEVYQAVKLPLSELSFTNDLVIKNVEDVVLGSCSGKMSPRITFNNAGTESLTSAVFNVKVGNETLSTYQWEGNIAVGENTEIIFPEFVFGDASNFVIEATEINGNNDGYPVDNIYEISVAEPLVIEDGYIKLQLKTGNDPENLTIEIKNMDNDEVLYSFEYEEPKTIYNHEMTLPEIGCYRMTIRNTEGNGFGGGFWGVRDSDNTTLMVGTSTDNDFRYEFAFEFDNKSVNVEEIESLNDVNIYPNPASSVINVTATNLTKIKIYNAVGQLIHSEEASSDNVTVDTQNWTNGFYYVTVETANGNSTSQKIIVNK